MSQEQKELFTVTLSLDKKNQLCVAPQFTDHGVYIHPITNTKYEGLREGQDVIGWFAKCEDTGKKDKNGTRIFLRPFVVTAREDIAEVYEMMEQGGAA